MTSDEKIAYVKRRIKEEAKLHPAGSFYFELITVVDIEANGGIPDDAPIVLSRREQWSIIQKLAEEGFIRNVELDEKKQKVSLELVVKKTRRSNLLGHIKTTDQLLQHRELFEKFLHVIGETKNIKPNHRYTVPTEEQNDDLIQLLIDLSLAEYDWDEMQKQTHRQVGNRIIEFSFDGDAVLKLIARVSGKNGRIKREALERVCKDIGERLTFNKIVRFCTDLGVPESMFIKDTKWRALFYVLSYYSTSEVNADNLFALKIIQEVLHPLMFTGDESNVKEVRDKYREWLKYDGIHIDDDGKVYLGPTAEEWDLGMDEWTSADGQVVEPKAHLIYPERIAELWVLWSQVILLVQAYQSNPALDRKELEKLYLEVIGRVEDLIEAGKVGNLSEKYQRPFTSLTTAEVEMRAKKAESAIDLISILLLEITAMSPSPQEIAKKTEENTELIERITAATRAIGGEKIDIPKLSHEQAVFILKLVFGHLYSILEAFSTGYLNMTDEQLNAQYITLLDNFNKLLDREDFQELKKNAPDVPNHLFEGIDEMDIWWEHGGKAGMMSLYGDIELMWVRGGQQSFPLPQWFVVYLNTVDETVKQHRKTKAAHWKRMEEDIDRRKAAGEFGFGGQSQDAEKTPQKVVHEHTHRFENSIQEKDIGINHKFDGKKPTGFYITKDGDDFLYKGKYLELSPRADYYRVFSVLYSLVPKGGEVSYKNLIDAVKKSIRKVEDKSDEELRKFIQRNLTDKSNGFLRYASIPEREDNGKPLLSVIRGSGIIFNNGAG